VLALQFIHKLPAIMLRFSKRLLTIAALSCAAMPCLASEQAQPEQPAACKQPDYPRNALKQGQEGISRLGFLVRPDGTVARSIVLGSTSSCCEAPPNWGRQGDPFAIQRLELGRLLY